MAVDLKSEVLLTSELQPHQQHDKVCPRRSWRSPNTAAGPVLVLTPLVDHLYVAVHEPRAIWLSGRCRLSLVALEKMLLCNG